MKNICLLFILILFTACRSDSSNSYEQVADKAQITSPKRIEAIVEQYDGFISGMNQSTSNYSIDNKMTLRIPAEALEKFLAEIEQEAVYTHHKRIQVQDVTEEFVDKTSRLNTKKEVRDRYIAILRDKAKTVKDVYRRQIKVSEQSNHFEYGQY